MLRLCDSLVLLCLMKFPAVCLLWVRFEIRFQENISFQNPISTFALLCFVKITTITKQNGKQQKTKNPTKKLFQGIKSFGLDRIIDIWILLQPEEERKKREYPPGRCSGRKHSSDEGREKARLALSQHSYFPPGEGWS